MRAGRFTFGSEGIAGLCGCIALFVTGCGGGGGGGEATPTNQPPTAAARVTGEAVARAATVFDTAGTADVDGSIAARNWTYGDGESGTADSHTYRVPGSYTATYQVTDDKGTSSRVSVRVNIAKCSVAGSAAAALSPHPTVCVQTSRGEMVFEVYPTQSPITSSNFLKYVDDDFYAGTLFHRVIAGFVVQAGGYQAGMVSKPATYAPITLESANGLQNWQYTLAMARTDQSNSATSQFFVNVVDNLALNYSAANPLPNGYAVLGQIIHGTAVVDAMANVTTGTASGFMDVPMEDIVIKGMVRLP